MTKMTFGTIRKPAVLGSLKIAAGTSTGRSKRVRFGSAVYTGPVPERDVVERNIAAGREALARGLEALTTKPGIKLKKVKGAPLFSADPTDPTLLIREIDGKREKVRFEDGDFKVVA